MTDYAKGLIEKATQIFDEKFEEMYEGCAHKETNFFYVGAERGIVIMVIAKHLNRRGNKKAIPFKDWLFYNRLGFDSEMLKRV